jgi:hypothetical protein
VQSRSPARSGYSSAAAAGSTVDVTVDTVCMSGDSCPLIICSCCCIRNGHAAMPGTMEPCAIPGGSTCIGIICKKTHVAGVRGASGMEQTVYMYSTSV